MSWTTPWILVVCIATACGSSDPDEFEFRIRVSVEKPLLDPNLEILFDGRLITEAVAFENFFFPSYADALEPQSAIVIETRANGATVSACVLRAGVCRGACAPMRETAVACVLADGRVRLGSFSCQCNGATADYFCAGDCDDTGPD